MTSELHVSRVPSEINSSTCSDKSDTQSSGYPSSGSRSGDMESQFRETGSARESQCGDTCSTRSSVSGDSDSYRDVIQSVLTQSPGSTAAMTGPGVMSGRGSRASQISQERKICDLPAAQNIHD